MRKASVKNTVLITGSEGGIGSAICDHLKNVGYRTIGIDIFSADDSRPDVIHEDLRLLDSTEKINSLKSRITEQIGDDRLVAVVNNAAIQILNSFDSLSIEDFIASMQVNCTATFGVTKACFELLNQSKGTVLNIGSVHAKLTKPCFVAYATSKSAIEGLTRALAVDIGSSVKVCCISPAAIDTDMLSAGFSNGQEDLEKLASYHPSNCIGTTGEIARLAEFLISEKASFSNGAVWSMSGGICSVLHDPAG